MQDRLLVGIDVGCRQHRVAIARSNGEIVKEFSVPHNASGFGTLFSELEHFESTFKLPIVIGMEGLTDAIDARKIVELMRWAPHLQEQRRVVTEVKMGNAVNQTLKRLSRRRRPN